MSATFYRTPTTVALDTYSAPTKIPNQQQDEERSDQSALLTMIQSQNAPTPYVHPLVSRSLGLMSKSSLEMCTESLGSETGSGDFSDDSRNLSNSFSNEDDQVVVKHNKLQERISGGKDDGNQLMSVNCRYSISRRSAVQKTFPPPLSSISRRDSSSIQMITCRHDGHLVVDAVPIASQNYLHVRRHEGRLLLTFINSTAATQSAVDKTTQGPLVTEPLVAGCK